MASPQSWNHPTAIHYLVTALKFKRGGVKERGLEALKGPGFCGLIFFNHIPVYCTFTGNSSLPHGVAMGRVAASQLQSPWCDPEFGLLSMWSFMCSSHIHEGFLQVFRLATLNCPKVQIPSIVYSAHSFPRPG